MSALGYGKVANVTFLTKISFHHGNRLDTNVSCLTCNPKKSLKWEKKAAKLVPSSKEVHEKSVGNIDHSADDVKTASYN